VRKFLCHGIGLLALNLGLAVVALATVGGARDYAPWQTDSIFEGNDLREPYDIIVLGTSRAYALSRFRLHHEYLEDALGANVLNAALPTGGGIKPAAAYLEELLASGVRPECVLLALDPFVLYNIGSNEHHPFVEQEPFRWSFWLRLASMGFEWRRLAAYPRSKFGRSWLQREAAPLIGHARSVDAIDREIVERRMQSLYVDGVQPSVFERYADYVNRIAETCREADARLEIVFLPTLLGHEPGHARTLERASLLAQSSARVRVHDWTNVLRDRTLFYDLDHLNTRGVRWLADERLAPLLRART